MTDFRAIEKCGIKQLIFSKFTQSKNIKLSKAKKEIS